MLLSGVGRLAGSEGYFTFIQALPVALLQPFLQLFHQHLPTHSANINTQSFSLHQSSPFPTQSSPFITQLSPSPHSNLPSLHSRLHSLHSCLLSPYSCCSSLQLSPFSTVVSLYTGLLLCGCFIQVFNTSCDLIFIFFQISKSFLILHCQCNNKDPHSADKIAAVMC